MEIKLEMKRETVNSINFQCVLQPPQAGSGQVVTENTQLNFLLFINIVFYLTFCAYFMLINVRWLIIPKTN
jgi:hypothetical protein